MGKADEFHEGVFDVGEKKEFTWSLEVLVSLVTITPILAGRFAGQLNCEDGYCGVSL